MSSRASRTLYVGNLPGDTKEREVEDLFYKYGLIVDIDLKIPPRPPRYCFIELEHARDAEDVIRGRDGYNIDGNRLRVELAHGGRGQSSTNDGYSSRAGQTLYVGNLPGDIREREVKDLFYKYGPIVDIDLKIPPRPPRYCFIEFEHARNAEDAIRGRDGYNFDGNRLRVKLAHGGRGQSSTNDDYSSRASQTLYVGNLPGDIREREVEGLFYKYGLIVDIDLKIPPRPPRYCFIKFEHARHAEDSIRGRDGFNFDGNRLRVKLAHGYSSHASQTIYVGNLPGDIRQREVEGLFYKYGLIADIDLKIPPRPPGYCFIEFEPARDAEDAIRGRDGYNFDGNRLRVELAQGGRGQSSANDGYSSYSSAGGGRSGGVSRRLENRVHATGPRSSLSSHAIGPRSSVASSPTPHATGPRSSVASSPTPHATGPRSSQDLKFERARDAEDAIRGRDGYNTDGNRLRVGLGHGGRGPSSTSDGYSSYGIASDSD